MCLRLVPSKGNRKETAAPQKSDEGAGLDSKEAKRGAVSVTTKEAEAAGRHAEESRGRNGQTRSAKLSVKKLKGHTLQEPYKERRRTWGFARTTPKGKLGGRGRRFSGRDCAGRRLIDSSRRSKIRGGAPGL